MKFPHSTVQDYLPGVTTLYYLANFPWLPSGCKADCLFRIAQWTLQQSGHLHWLVQLCLEKSPGPAPSAHRSNGTSTHPWPTCGVGDLPGASISCSWSSRSVFETSYQSWRRGRWGQLFEHKRLLHGQQSSRVADPWKTSKWTWPLN